jgi:hypothetical protein
MSRDMAKHLIHDHGVSPSVLGRAAHKIKDYIEISGTLYVRTARHDWHPCTARERNMIKTCQLSLAI